MSRIKSKPVNLLQVLKKCMKETAGCCISCIVFASKQHTLPVLFGTQKKALDDFQLQIRYKGTFCLTNCLPQSCHLATGIAMFRWNTDRCAEYVTGVPSCV